MIGVSRRGVSGPPLSMDEAGNNWKGNQGGDTPNPGNFAPNNANNNFGSGVFPPSNQGSPAGNMQGNNFQGGPPPGSNTPQYTASPAPSGSSTPGPPSSFPPPQNNSGPFGNVNGPTAGPGGPFGSPSSNGPQSGHFGRPGSSGPPFGPQPPFPPNNFVGGGPFPPMQGPGGSPFHGHGPQAGSGPHPGMAGPQGPHPGMMGGPPQGVDRLDPRFHISSGLNVGRRHSYFGQPDYRIYELNKRLQQRTDQDSDNCWWDSFANEFFEDEAQLTLTFCLEDGPKRYTIGRTLIPRYFRSIFEGGVTELYYNLKHSKESFHNTSITLDCEQCTMVTHHSKPMYTKVCTEGRLVLEFTFDDLMRIKTWHMAVRAHREMIPRNVVSMHTHPSQSDPAMLDQLSKNITRQGITNSTLNYLRLCVILEPMQELMSRHKAYSLSPRDCLKTTLFQKWQRMVAPPGKRENSIKDAQRPSNKRRKRKGSSGAGVPNSTPPVPNKKRSPGPNFSLASQDVMVVGEPSLMGGEFGDEDERLITRLENTQYDGTNSLDHESHGFGHADSPLSNPNSWVDRGGGSGMNPNNNPQIPQDSQDKKSPVIPPQ